LIFDVPSPLFWLRTKAADSAGIAGAFQAFRPSFWWLWWTTTSRMKAQTTSENGSGNLPLSAAKPIWQPERSGLCDGVPHTDWLPAGHHINLTKTVNGLRGEKSAQITHRILWFFPAAQNAHRFEAAHKITQEIFRMIALFCHKCLEKHVIVLFN